MDANQGLTFITGVLPVIMNFVRQHQAERGTIPTDDEVQIHLTTDANAVLTVSDAWLNAHSA